MGSSKMDPQQLSQLLQQTPGTAPGQQAGPPMLGTTGQPVPRPMMRRPMMPQQGQISPEQIQAMQAQRAARMQQMQQQMPQGQMPQRPMPPPGKGGLGSQRAMPQPPVQQ